MSGFILTFVIVWVCGLVISCFTLKFCLHVWCQLPPSVCVHLPDQLITPESLTSSFLLSLCPASGSCLSLRASLVCTFITVLFFHSCSVLVFISSSCAQSLFHELHFLLCWQHCAQKHIKHNWKMSRWIFSGFIPVLKHSLEQWSLARQPSHRTPPSSPPTWQRINK